MVELVSFGSVFDSFCKVVIGLFWDEVDEVYSVFFEVDEFSDSVTYGRFRIVLQSGEHESFELFPGFRVNIHTLQILTEM